MLHLNTKNKKTKYSSTILTGFPLTCPDKIPSLSLNFVGEFSLTFHDLHIVFVTIHMGSKIIPRFSTNLKEQVKFPYFQDKLNFP